jgi:hypothetical protein
VGITSGGSLKSFPLHKCELLRPPRRPVCIVCRTLHHASCGVHCIMHHVSYTASCSMCRTLHHAQHVLNPWRVCVRTTWSRAVWLFRSPAAAAAAAAAAVGAGAPAAAARRASAVSSAAACSCIVWSTLCEPVYPCRAL